MSLLTGELAFLWASIIALPVSIGITAVLMWVYRWSPIQRIVFPGADECRLAERFFTTMLAQTTEKPMRPCDYEAISRLGHGILLRNGMNAIAVAVIFFSVFTGSHALLLAL